MLNSRLLNAHNLYEEIVLSYSILFSRNPQSRAIARKLFASHGLNVAFVSEESPALKPRTVVITNWEIYFFGQTPMLSHFQYYRGHFAFLQQQMKEWTPQTARDLLQPGYTGRLTWFATMFGIFIGVVGVLSLVTGIISAVVGYIAMNAALESLRLSRSPGGQ